MAPPVARVEEFLKPTETLSCHSGTEAGAFEREAEVGGEVGRVANLALCPQGFLRGHRCTGDDVENGFQRAGR